VPARRNLHIAGGPVGDQYGVLDSPAGSDDQWLSQLHMKTGLLS
jgi:hypothetical protein